MPKDRERGMVKFARQAEIVHLRFDWPIIGAIVVTTLLAGAVRAQPIPPNVAARFATSSDRYANCMIRLAGETDDQRSDASTIASAIQGGCQEELESYVDATVTLVAIHLGAPWSRNVIEQTYGQDRYGSALKAVLFERGQGQLGE